MSVWIFQQQVCLIDHLRVTKFCPMYQLNLKQLAILNKSDLHIKALLQGKTKRYLRQGFMLMTDVLICQLPWHSYTVRPRFKTILINRYLCCYELLMLLVQSRGTHKIRKGPSCPLKKSHCFIYKTTLWKADNIAMLIDRIGWLFEESSL